MGGNRSTTGLRPYLSQSHLATAPLDAVSNLRVATTVSGQFSAFGGVSGASAGTGGKRSVPSGAGAGAAGAGAVPPIWSMIDPVPAFCAANTVNVIEVPMNKMAKSHVNLVNAVAAALPDIAPPPPIPRPPPSDRCSRTTPIKSRARIKWTVRITFSMGFPEADAPI
jgi:hypothetical protein